MPPSWLPCFFETTAITLHFFPDKAIEFYNFPKTFQPSFSRLTGWWVQVKFSINNKVFHVVLGTLVVSLKECVEANFLFLVSLSAALLWLLLVQTPCCIFSPESRWQSGSPHWFGTVLKCHSSFSTKTSFQEKIYVKLKIECRTKIKIDLKHGFIENFILRLEVWKVRICNNWILWQFFSRFSNFIERHTRKLLADINSHPFLVLCTFVGWFTLADLALVLAPCLNFCLESR